MKKQLVRHRDTCRGCESRDMQLMVDLGTVPLAGGFLSSEEEISHEEKFPLQINYCRNCGLVQVSDIINPEVLFKKYFYVSSVIRSLSEHFADYADYLVKKFGAKGDLKILEFGCNDGVLLQYLERYPCVESYGIDPSENVTKIARDKGHKVFTDYFNQKSANKLVEEVGKVDIVTGSNVFAHTDDILEILEAAKIILKPNGVFIVEVHYLKDLLEKNQYDTLYHEHLSYYSVSSLKNILDRVGMKLINVTHLPMHGGAIRVEAALKGADLKVDPSVKRFIKKEGEINSTSVDNFGSFCKSHSKDLIDLLNKIKSEGKSIVGYGAAGRGTILLNYCGIGPEYLNYIVDVSPLRAGKLMPGVHVPIFDVSKARENPPDYFLVMAWNYYDSIRAQEEELVKNGVKFIVPLPEIRVE